MYIQYNITSGKILSIVSSIPTIVPGNRALYEIPTDFSGYIWDYKVIDNQLVFDPEEEFVPNE